MVFWQISHLNIHYGSLNFTPGGRIPELGGVDIKGKMAGHFPAFLPRLSGIHPGFAFGIFVHVFIWFIEERWVTLR